MLSSSIVIYLDFLNIHIMSLNSELLCHLNSLTALYCIINIVATFLQIGMDID